MSNANFKTYTTDVLVIGGGPAGAWAAWSAAQTGAKVILVDKGYLGSSGATAPGGTNLLYLPPDQALRDTAVEMRMNSGGFLSEPDWIYRVLDQVFINLDRVEQWGYPFVRDENGDPQRNHLHGPEYMALMRKQVKKAGVTVLDHAPALELLVDEHGVGGARGVLRQQNKEWEIKAGAVVIATGGCAFLSKGLGCNVLTGDGYLMSAEAGAELSGMEFSRQYAPSAAFSSPTRGRLLGWATYYDEDGNEIDRDREGDFLAKRLLNGGSVYAMMNKADTPEKQAILRSAHSIFFLPYDRAGINVFTDLFPLTLRYEGTVRGTGGLRIVTDDCGTTVPGLYAAGDASTRERITGAASGGGAFNASWAICSGTWSGEGAANYAKKEASTFGERELHRAGKYGLKAESTTGSVQNEETPTVSKGSLPASNVAESNVLIKELVKAIQNEILPLEKNYFRTESGVQESLNILHELWPKVQHQKIESIHDVVHAREAAAMAATARWIYTAALARKETRGRGLHSFKEYPEQDPNQHHRIIVSGLEEIQVSYDTSFLDKVEKYQELHKKEVQTK
ncbi:FAD-dependent oxidoreductase [Paenibacillus sp. Marseille-Q7038]